jgi:hypothetical protein
VFIGAAPSSQLRVDGTYTNEPRNWAPAELHEELARFEKALGAADLREASINTD